MNRDNRPTYLVEDTLNEAEQAYLRNTFSDYKFQFPNQGGHSRPHALAANSRNVLERLLLHKVGTSHVLDLGGNFARHYTHREFRPNIVSINFDNNPDDIARNDSRIARINQRVGGTQWLERHVQLIRGTENRGAPIEGYNTGIMIHALYNNSPEQIYNQMVHYNLTTLYATINQYEDGKNMYCNSMRWEYKPEQGIYLQTDVIHNTSVYTHTEDPSQWSKISYITGTDFIIKVEVWQNYGDQDVILFTKIARNRITGDFDDKKPIIDQNTTTYIHIPRISHYNYGLPVMVYHKEPFTPHRLLVRRIGSILMTEHPTEPNVFQFAVDYLNKLNLKAITTDGKVTIKIDLDADDVLKQAAYITQKHREHIHTYMMLNAPTTNHSRPVHLLGVRERLSMVMGHYTHSLRNFFWPTNPMALQKPDQLKQIEHSNYVRFSETTCRQEVKNLNAQVDQTAEPGNPLDPDHPIEDRHNFNFPNTPDHDFQQNQDLHDLQRPGHEQPEEMPRYLRPEVPENQQAPIITVARCVNIATGITDSLVNVIPVERIYNVFSGFQMRSSILMVFPWMILAAVMISLIYTSAVMMNRILLKISEIMLSMIITAIYTGTTVLTLSTMTWIFLQVIKHWTQMNTCRFAWKTDAFQSAVLELNACTLAKCLKSPSLMLKLMLEGIRISTNITNFKCNELFANVISSSKTRRCLSFLGGLILLNTSVMYYTTLVIPLITAVLILPALSSPLTVIHQTSSLTSCNKPECLKCQLCTSPATIYANITSGLKDNKEFGYSANCRMATTSMTEMTCLKN